MKLLKSQLLIFKPVFHCNQNTYNFSLASIVMWTMFICQNLKPLDVFPSHVIFITNFWLTVERGQGGRISHESRCSNGHLKNMIHKPSSDFWWSFSNFLKSVTPIWTFLFLSKQLYFTFHFRVNGNKSIQALFLW